MAEPIKAEEGPRKPVVDEAKRKAKEEILKKIQDILKEYDGKESNIPLNHDYWNLANQYRAE